MPDDGMGHVQERCASGIVAANELQVGDVHAAEKWSQARGADFNIDAFEASGEFFLDPTFDLARLKDLVVGVPASVAEQGQQNADTNESSQALPCGHARAPA